MADYAGALKDIPAPELGATAARAAFERTSIQPEWIDHVVYGHVLLAGGGIYHVRHLALKAGIPTEVPALGVNRLCGSGIQAAISGAQMILSGDAEIVLTGGMESMSQAPHLVHGLRSGLKLGQGPMEDSLWAALNDSYAGCAMAQTAENCAAQYGITRQEQDCFALRSQQLAARAWREGRLGEEVVPVSVKTRKGVQTFDRDDHVRPDASIEALTKLSPALSREGTVTAGNASGIVDGAAALILASERAVNDRQLQPIGRLIGWATVGVDPKMMGMGPAPATRAVLRKTQLELGDLDLIEVNEAFAAQYLAVEKELQLDRDRVNVNGGAIALGHPLGASGTRQLLTLLMEMRRRGARRGLATACIGGGQGIAAIVESVS
jgi:acetyl-CoA acetyltransferase family protein